MISENRVKADFITLKKLAYKYYKKNNYKSCLNKIRQAAILAYNYNISETYGDSDLEHVVSKIAEQTLNINFNNALKDDRIIFYDYFGWDNRGLTQQYLYTLNQLNFKILYITRFELDKKKSSDILTYISKNKNILLTHIPTDLDDIPAAQFVLNKIAEFNPAKAFLHLSPWDTVAFLAFNSQSEIIKYFINLTDHSFWLGKNTINYCLEFRNFGYQLSTKFRGIDKQKCIIIPYYPILQDENRFEGLPKELEGKTIMVCGGNAYKFSGDGNAFYKLVKPILKKHKQTVLLIIGANSLAGKLLEDSETDGIDNQFFFLNDRYDISEVIKRCDLYISSYPISGGLMAQIAAAVGIPIVAYTKTSLPLNNLEDLIPFSDERFKTFTSTTEFEKTTNLLIEDLDYRLAYANYTSNKLINSNQFVSFVKDLFNGNYSNEIIEIKDIAFERSTFTKILVEQKTYKEYKDIFYSNLTNADLVITNFKTILGLLIYKLKRRFFK